MKKGLTVSVIFKAQSLNYGEGFGNISELKKVSRGDGNQYTVASRQCIRYDIVRLGAEIFNWNLQVVDKSCLLYTSRVLFKLKIHLNGKIMNKFDWHLFNKVLLSYCEKLNKVI